MTAAASAAIFLGAAACELAGTYVVWRWLREGATPWLVAVGTAFLVGYAVLQSRQPVSEYGRAYAAYAGIFLIGAIAWGWLADGRGPDRFDLLGGAVVLLGVLTILLGRRFAG